MKKIKIEIIEYSCTTKAIKYEAGQENIIWTKDLLSDCVGIKTNPTEQSLHVTVMPSIEGAGNIKYCLNFLEVVLYDGTIYKSPVPNSYRTTKFTQVLNKV